MNQETRKPTNKVTAGVLAGAVVTILTFVAGQFFGVSVSPEVATGLTTFVTFVVSYFTKEA